MCYVIESYAGCYWNGRFTDSNSFTDETDGRAFQDAVKFFDRGSAEAVRCSILSDDCRRLTRVVEHKIVGE
jgi:hypothetical protein